MDNVAPRHGRDTLLGNQDNDTIDAGGSTNLVFGGLGDDILITGAGNDLISGNEGNDTITGGGGNDTMAGGTGADRFVFLFGSGNDQVNGFGFAEGDRLDLQGQTFTQAASGGRQPLLLTLSGGGTIELNGVTPGSFSPAFIA